MITIPMAGQSRRFSAAGYTEPKFMLPLAGATLFDWSLRSFESYFGSEHFAFILRDVQGSKAFVANRLRSLGVKRFSIIVLDRETAGQAETVQLGIDHMGVDDVEPLHIFNIDTIRPGILLKRRTGSAGGLEVFQAAGNNWSFIEPADPTSPWVRRCTEKVRISNYCCTGLYSFSQTADFRQAIQAERQSPTAPELYVAPLFNHLIAKGLQVEWFEVASDQVLLSGVPHEYQALAHRDIGRFFGK